MSLIPVAPLYLAHSRSARPLPSRLNRPCRSSRSLHCISLTPARLDRYPRGLTGHVAHPGRSIVSRSLPLVSTATLAALPALSLTPVAPLYLARSSCARPLPSRLCRPCRSPRSLHCISLAPAALDRYPRGFAGHVAHPGRSIVSRSLQLRSTATLAALPAMSLTPV